MVHGDWRSINEDRALVVRLVSFSCGEWRRVEESEEEWRRVEQSGALNDVKKTMNNLIFFTPFKRS